LTPKTQFLNFAFSKGHVFNPTEAINELSRILPLLLVFLFIGCVDRDRSNPLDPKNPNTLGKPSGLQVVSRADSVFLTWDRLGLSDITGIQLYRKTESENEFVPFALLPADVTSFTDVPVAFGIEHSYQISAKGNEFESLRSDVVLVEPGPTFSWIADNASQQLFKLTHDARHILATTFGFITALDIEPNPITGEAWVIDFVASVLGQVVKLTPDGQLSGPLVDLQGPRDAALHHETGDLWVGDVLDKSVIKIDGQNNNIVLRIPDFEIPSSLAVDQRDGSCWVADRGLQQVIKLSIDGARSLNVSPTISSVRWLDVDSNDGAVWVSDSTAILRLSTAGELEFRVTPPAGFVYKLAVNQRTGEFWVLNWSPSSVAKYLKTGEQLFKIDGFDEPEDLAVNSFDGSCLVADTRNNRVVRIASDGSDVRIVREFRFPIAVGIQNEP